MNRIPLRALALGAGLLAASAALAQDTPPTGAPALQAPAPPPAAAEPAAAAPPDAALEPSQAPPPAIPPAPEPVQVQSLGQLDLFSTGRDAGLGQDLWRGSSAEIARAVIPSLATGALSPAASGLARRVLAQTATAPAGAGSDLKLAIARGQALMALGDADDASLVFDRTPGVADNPDLSRLAVEAALVSEEDDKACRIASALTTGRDTPYWLRVRAFCQVRAGKPDQAQLTLELAGPQDKDAALTRLLGVYVAGVGDPGLASLHTGLDFAVSRALKLDLTPALKTAAPAIARRWVLKNPPPEAPAPDLAAGSVSALIQAAAQVAEAASPDPDVLEQLVDRAARESGPKTRPRLEAAAAILASLGVPASGAARERLADFSLGRAEAPAALRLALERAADAGLKGETALLALRIARAGGAAGPGPVDRCDIIRALGRAGFGRNARAFAVEGLIQLRGGS